MGLRDGEELAIGNDAKRAGDGAGHCGHATGHTHARGTGYEPKLLIRPAKTMQGVHDRAEGTLG